MRRNPVLFIAGTRVRMETWIVTGGNYKSEFYKKTDSELKLLMLQIIIRRRKIDGPFSSDIRLTIC